MKDKDVFDIQDAVRTISHSSYGASLTSAAARLCQRKLLRSPWAWPTCRTWEQNGRCCAHRRARLTLLHRALASQAKDEDTEHNKLKKRKNQSALQRLKEKIKEKKKALRTTVLNLFQSRATQNYTAENL